MFKITYKATESANFFKWFKTEHEAKSFASTVENRFIKMEKM